MAVIVAIISTFVVTASAAATVFPDTINVVDGIATIDGIVSPGEWDDCTEILIKLSTAIEDNLEGNPSGAGLVGGSPEDLVPAGQNDDDMTVSVRIKVDSEYIYILETRKDKTMHFTTEDAQVAYSSDGSIIFFCRDGENLNNVDIFAVADTVSKTGPQFSARFDNVDIAPVSAVEAKATINAADFVLEYKLKLSDLKLTYADLKDGQYRVTYCAVNVYNEEFTGDVSGLWAPNAYQIQYKGVGPWDESPIINVVEGAAWPKVEEEPAAQETTPTAEETQPAEEPVITPTPDKTPSSPATGDAGIIGFAILAIAAAAVICLKKKA